MEMEQLVTPPQAQAMNYTKPNRLGIVMSKSCIERTVFLLSVSAPSTGYRSTVHGGHPSGLFAASLCL